ncbi:MAG: S-adenosylmethionine:tRNA ribosyltransferase-isomerase, partial [Lapillicoccus sp.]
MTALSEHPATTFVRAPSSFAPAPAESRGVARDGVRLLVARHHRLTHAVFRDLPDHLGAGDLVVVNTSATLAAEWDARSAHRGAVVLHAATRLDEDRWVVEVRTAPHAARAVLDADPGERFTAGGVEVELQAPYPRDGSSPSGRGNRLWAASVTGDLSEHLRRHGRPIAYGYLDRRYPLSAYQTVFGQRPGSAEMPSAGRPFTQAMITELVSRGVAVAPVTLHTGVSSQESGEAPLPEWFDVPEATARIVNAVRAGGGRVVAVGTTV